jgi:outer membrane lipoprotein SlyB
MRIRQKTERNMETTSKSMHPLTAIAAVSVTLFSLAGIGAITGLIPTSHGQSTQAQTVATTEAQAKSGENAATAATGAALAEKIAAHKAAPRSAAGARKATKPAGEPAIAASYEPPLQVAQNDPPARVEPAPRAEPVKPLCYDCGVIESMREIEKKGEGSGLGAAVGGVAGGLLGHQTGGGRGRDVMTVLGAIGGAVAGHQVEKNVKKVKSYEIAIRLDDGSSRLITQDNPPAWRAGDRVRLVNGVISAGSNS